MCSAFLLLWPQAYPPQWPMAAALLAPVARSLTLRTFRCCILVPWLVSMTSRCRALGTDLGMA